MRKYLMLLGTVGLLVVSTGCYHATIETGATPSTVEIRKAFASSWVYGLVPPSPVSTMARCTNGVARVETRLSFVNQLVTFLTLGIYSPMEIVVTCAAAGSAMHVPSGAAVVGYEADSPESLNAAMIEATRRAVVDRQVVYLQGR